MAAYLDPHTQAELSLDDIKALCDDLFEAHKDWLPEYKQEEMTMNYKKIALVIGTISLLLPLSACNNDSNRENQTGKKTLTYLVSSESTAYTNILNGLLKEFNETLTMLANWSKYILNAFECPYSNGFTEGTNNKIKVIKRKAYGFRNFENFRNRILITSI